MGWVKNVPSPNSAGNSKSAGPGLWNSDDSATSIRVLKGAFPLIALDARRRGYPESGLTVSDPDQVQSSTHTCQQAQHQVDGVVEPLGDEPARATPDRDTGCDQPDRVPCTCVFSTTQVIVFVRAHGTS